jgi:DNA repair protein RadC
MAHFSNVPKHERPREKLIEKGPENLRDNELIAILLGTGYAGKNVIEVANEILCKFPTKNLLSLDYIQLSKIKGIGPSKACSMLAAFEMTKRALEVEDNNLPTINSIKEVIAQLQELRTAKKEHFVVLYLNARNQLVHKETISVGTLSENLVHPREVFKPAIDCLAASIIIAHNHPSGNCEPSREDIAITLRLQEAGKILGIDIIDHVVVVDKSCSSFKELGLIS